MSLKVFTVVYSRGDVQRRIKFWTLHKITVFYVVGTTWTDSSRFSICSNQSSAVTLTFWMKVLLIHFRLNESVTVGKSLRTEKGYSFFFSSQLSLFLIRDYYRLYKILEWSTWLNIRWIRMLSNHSIIIIEGKPCSSDPVWFQFFEQLIVWWCLCRCRLPRAVRRWSGYETWCYDIN